MGCSSSSRSSRSRSAEPPKSVDSPRREEPREDTPISHEGSEALGVYPELRLERERLWREFGGDELEEPLQKAWVKLVRASWLVRLAERGGVLRRRQDLPQQAFVGLDELKAAGPHRYFDGVWLRVIVLSYPWLQPNHPDPHGESLRVIAEMLKSYVNAEDGGKPYGVLIDFTALFQADRTEEENRIFELALPALSLFYSHPYTIVFKVTQFPAGYPHKGAHRYVLPKGANTVPYAERGWCYTESAMSGLVKSSDKVLDLGRLHRNSLPSDPRCFSPATLAGRCQAKRTPPLHPDDVIAELDKKTFTSKQDDLGKVAELYSAAFQRCLESALELDYASLGWGPEEVRKLVRALQHNGSIQVLNFFGNNIGSEGAAVLGEALRVKTSLLKLNLGGNGIGPEGATALGEALRVNNSLQELQLLDNHVGSRGAAALAEALRVNTSLENLRLTENRIGPEGAAALGRALRVNASLRELRLESNNISRDSAAGLGEALQSNASLQKLFLYDNSINSQGAVALGEALLVNTSLQELDLGSNNIDQGGAAALGEALRSNTSLQKLFLASNGIDSLGAASLGQALLVNTSLQELNLSFNRIDRDGAVALAEALRGNSTLQALDLQENQIGPEGAAALRDAARSSRVQFNVEGGKGSEDRLDSSFGIGSAHSEWLNELWCSPKERGQ